MNQIFPGERLFELKATHGLPLEVAVDRLFDSGVRIDWCGFIDCARSNGWYDFQTIRLIEQALDDCLIEKSIRAAISNRSKSCIMSTLTHAN